MVKKRLYQVVKLEPTQMCWIVAHSEGQAERLARFDREGERCFGCEDMVGMGTSEFYATELISPGVVGKIRKKFPKEMEEVESC
jgi:hypothetical protein